LHAQGTSQSQLYVYRENGKLLRQLTKADSGQDSAPIFSTDGESIVFAREKPNNVREFWSIKPRGTDLKKLDAAPDCCAEVKSSPHFTNVEPEELPIRCGALRNVHVSTRRYASGDHIAAKLRMKAESKHTYETGKRRKNARTQPGSSTHSKACVKTIW
jgi:hypothetical protein